MRRALSEQVLQQLFVDARTHHEWQDRRVPELALREIYDIAKWGPTSANCLPMRILFVISTEQKERLVPCLIEPNVSQVRKAPVTAIIAYDAKFFDHLPVLFPAMDLKPLFAANPAWATETAFRSGTLQGAYLIIAARALGLDVGPMSGFDNAKVDDTFFKNSTWKSNFLCNIGYGEDEKVYPRGPRLNFDTAARII